MAKHPCAGKSKVMTAAFEQIAIGNDGGHSPRTIAALLKAGLIVQSGTHILGRDRFGVCEVAAYAVPIPVHMQWCEYCASAGANE